jgi:hypothetical protein
MIETRVSAKNVIEGQIPLHFQEEYPLFGPFLKQYYESQDHFSSPLSIVKNIDQLLKVGTYSSIVINSDPTFTSQFVDYADNIIYVDSTAGWPDRYGLLKINNEIITYTSIGATFFNGCIRGFSGITTYNFYGKQVDYETTENNSHEIGSKVENLSTLFLKEFFKKIKKQYLPGFENLKLDTNTNQTNLLIQSKDFYSSKGTPKANNIIFKSLFSEEAQTIKPQDYLIKPSSNDYRPVRQIVISPISGNPLNLNGTSIYQEVETTSGISSSYASVSNVETNIFNGKQYYTLDIDFGYDRDTRVFGSIYGNFEIHPKTKVLDSKESTLIVDSTVGFAHSGSFVVNNTTVTYDGKTNNQFLNCKSIPSVSIGDDVVSTTHSTYGIDANGNRIDFRVNGVIEKFNNNPTTGNYYLPGDTFLIDTLGILKEKNDPKFNCWKFNISTKFYAKSIDYNGQYFVVETFEDHLLSLNDRIEFVNDIDNSIIDGKVERIISDRKIQVSSNLEVSNKNLNNLYFIRRKINLSNTETKFVSDVQNVYDLDNDVIITSPSLPSYRIESDNRSKSFSIVGFTTVTEITIPNHDFYTGDIVEFSSSSDIFYGNVKNYFVNKVDNSTILLALSNTNIVNNIFESFTNYLADDISVSLTPIGNSNKLITSQKLVRKISDPIYLKSQEEKTIPDSKVGILINGVEIQSYKSKEVVYHGPIESIDVLSGGNDYDVINPPILEIQDSTGVGATGICAVNGSLESIEIIDGGFDYLEVPQISISGGNGSGAKAEAKLSQIYHDVYFNAYGISTSSGGFISTTSNIIGFNTEHKFNFGESVIYNSFNGVKIGIGSTSGDLSTKTYLQDNSVYYVSIVDDNKIKLHSNKSDSILGKNEINLTEFGEGTQRFRSTRRKNIISSIKIIDSGFGYENKKRIANSSGINTSNDTINIKNHDYRDGELITYYSTQTPASGLDTSKNYYVTVVDKDNFKLSSAGIGTTNSKENYLTKQYVNIKSSGSGNHIFNYPNISVTINGRLGISRTDSSKFNGVIVPKFRGSITSIQMTNGGSGYGSEDIINFDKQPSINFNSGKNAVVKPIISGDKIESIVILNSGQDYNSLPSFNFEGPGSFAHLTPVIQDGKLISVKVINGGIGFRTDSSNIVVQSSGKNVSTKSNIKKWTVNKVEKYKNVFSKTEDDGIIVPGLNETLQYVNLFAPRNLRKNIPSKNTDGSNNYLYNDLIFDNNEIISNNHSPILGWAYDGHPIYGPYGYSTVNGGPIKPIKSGYELLPSPDRPNGFDPGFFVEDYIFTNNGDLDQNNGRFCKTPDYPNGVYAYFCTINGDFDGYDSSYGNYRRPVFPYVVGDTYKSKPEIFNYLNSSNQDDINFESENYIRNTYPYKLKQSKAEYEGFIEPYNLIDQVGIIDSTTIGSVTKVGIVSAGYGYKVGDSIVFNNENTDGRGAAAEINEIFESRITSLQSSILTIDNITLNVLTPSGLIEGISTVPHGLKNFDIVNISGISTDSLSKVSGFHKINVADNKFTLSASIGTTAVTGIVTYLNFTNTVNDELIRQNDILKITKSGIGTEKFLVLSVDPVFNRVKVKREYDGTVGYSYSSFSFVEEDPKRFRFNSGISTNIITSVRRKLFFEPSSSVSIGTVGSGTTVYTSIGARFVPLRTIYIPNHNLTTGQRVIYSNEENISLSVSVTGIGSTVLSNNLEVYVAKINEDLIGISTTPIGIGSTGGFSGIGTDSNLLYFTSYGTGNYHSFITQELQVTSKVEKNIATITTKQNHNLQVNDTIKVEVKPGLSTTVMVKYNSPNRRVVLNPKTFGSSGINTISSIININNHEFETGDKVIYTSTNPASGLEPDQIYYIVKIDRNNFRLTESSYQTSLSNPNYVSIASTGGNHEISKVNPSLSITKGYTVNFDLSDSSLSDINGGTRVQSFDFNLYDNNSFTNEFITSLKSNVFEVTKTGIIGVTNDAKLTLRVLDTVPNKLFYKLTPLINKSYLSKEKSEIIVDEDVLDFSSINFVESKYNGTYNISGIGSTTLSFVTDSFPESLSYDQFNSSIKYITSETHAEGSINKVDIIFGGKGYKSTPGINSIRTINGNGCILNAESSNIGNILKSTIKTPGFEYPSDKTLKPIAQLPQKLYVEQLYSIDSVGLSSGGKYYSTTPNFVVVDSITGDIKSEVELKAKLSGNIISQVDILKNTKTLYGNPRIITINNSNGIGVTNISYNPTTKNVTVNLASGFSTSSTFPFKVGSKILVEGIGINSIGKGYNSSEYNYNLFTLTGVTSAIGGSTGILIYKLEENPGEFSKVKSIQNGTNSFGKIVPESYLPIFNPKVSLGEFKYNAGEEVYIENEKIGVISKWDPVFKLLKINNYSRNIKKGEIIRGGATDNRSIVIDTYDSYGNFTVNSYNEKIKEYGDDTGKLSTFLQVLQDGDYYQNFSYSIKSKIPIEKWDDSINSLSHTAGFKKFSDLQVESETSDNNLKENFSILESDTDILVDIIQEKNFDCYENFAFAKESTKTFNNQQTSNQIYFDNLRLLDYTEFVSNRVLEIDDLSQQFDDQPNIFNYSTVGTFDITKYNAAQFYILIKDARYFGEKELIIVNVVYDGANGYITAYGRNETIEDLGSFGFRRSGNNGEVLFYPKKYEYNSYNMSNISVSLGNAGTSGIGSTSLGDVVSFASTAVAISSSLTPSENTIVSISTNSYSSAKVLLSASSNDTDIQFAEINVTNNGTNIYYDIFGDIDSGDGSPNYGSGIVGQVGVSTSSNNMLITFTPNPNLTVNVRALSILIGNTLKTGVGTTVMYKGELSSHQVSLASTSSPSEQIVSGFVTSVVDPHDGALYYVQVHDNTNKEVQFSEIVLTLDSEYNPSVSEYASLYSNNSLGSIGAAKSTSGCYLTFTPNPNIETEVRVFQKTLQTYPKQNPIEIDLNSAVIRSDTIPLGFEGTQISLRRNFNITHKSFPIFKKVIDGSSNNVVDVINDSINIPNHFFVTGEKIDYSTNGTRIGIATTTISGIGTTSFLPSTLYAVKINDSLVKFADTPEKALKFVPEVLDIVNVGVGQSHVFSSNYKSNSKTLISIDNVIQNPIVSTSTTTFVTTDTDDVSTTSFLYFDNIDDFYARDLIKIDNEFLLITDIGIGATNRVACRREQLGSISTVHTAGSTITKFVGNYNIQDDTIYFVEAPHGSNIDDSNSSFQGRVFLRSATVGSSLTAYYQNNIFDDISDQFNGTKNIFTLKSNSQDVSGIVSSNSISAGILLINNIFQKPKYPVTGAGQTYTYEVIENSGISSVVFSGNPVGLTTDGISGPMKFDINSSGIPRGGIIVSVGSTQGFGFQPLVSAGGTAIVSAAGTIQSISIGNSGSGYRPGIQTSIVVSIASTNGRIPIGTASAFNGNIVAVAVTHVGLGYTTTNPPIVIIDSPLNYDNIPLIYDSSNSGIGTEATVDIIVGYGNSVLEFNISNSGYGYSTGNILTFKVGGTTGIPTSPSLSYEPFRLTVNEVFKDKFNAWYPGQFVVLDDINGEFDGSKKLFTLKENGETVNFVSSKGSPIDLNLNLLVFINDTLQLPKDSYIFNGGSQIEFLEAPKSGDSVKILFFKGSDVDVSQVDVAPSIKVGDKLRLVDQLRSLRNVFTEDQRVVSEISTVDTVYTSPYYGTGITSDTSIIRTVEWCKQREDFYLNEVLVSKSREELNSNIFPITGIIRPVGVASTSIFVQNAITLFDYFPEVLPSSRQVLKIISQDPKQVAIATAVVSIAGTISNVVILDGGVGYSTNPSISISPSGFGTVAIATCSISGVGSVSQIEITNPGSGYTTTNPPQILISQESLKSEIITNAKYEGDFGIITGIGTTNIAGVSTGITFDFYIPQSSILRDSNEVGTALTISGIQTGYYFTVYDSIVGNGLTSINDDGSVLGIGTTNIDNVYQAFDVSIISGNAVGVGSTSQIVRVTTSVNSYNNLSGIGNIQNFGFFSWGRIYDFDRSSSPKEFTLSIDNGISGLSTAPVIIRANPMRSLYTS